MHFQTGHRLRKNSVPSYIVLILCLLLLLQFCTLVLCLGWPVYKPVPMKTVTGFSDNNNNNIYSPDGSEACNVHHHGVQ